MIIQQGWSVDKWRHMREGEDSTTLCVRNIGTEKIDHKIMANGDAKHQDLTIVLSILKQFITVLSLLF